MGCFRAEEPQDGDETGAILRTVATGQARMDCRPCLSRRQFIPRDPPCMRESSAQWVCGGVSPGWDPAGALLNIVNLTTLSVSQQCHCLHNVIPAFCGNDVVMQDDVVAGLKLIAGMVSLWVHSTLTASGMNERLFDQIEVVHDLNLVSLMRCDARMRRPRFETSPPARSEFLQFPLWQEWITP